MRLGGPLFADTSDPDKWVAAVKKAGYGAAYCPVDNAACDEVVNLYAAAAKKANLVIAEVGAWSDPLHPDETKRREAREHCKKQLDLAERIGARCCVNISGSRGELWDGHHPDNLTKETFEMIVAVTREIIDAVKPKRTYFTIEPMPWMYPDSPGSYVRLLKSIDRAGFAVHLDPANLLCSPQRYYGNADLIRECFAKLGPNVRSCHAKDILMSPKLTTHLDEVRAGLGNMDYRTYLRELSKLEPNVPLMLEHLNTEEEYTLAAEYIRSVAAAEKLEFV
jgi:sugar phosphate isomerase/epimerase